jgi:hypothetical protein
MERYIAAVPAVMERYSYLTRCRDFRRPMSDPATAERPSRRDSSGTSLQFVR